MEFEARTSRGVVTGKSTSAIRAAITLNSMYAMASRLAVLLAPIAASAELVAVPMFCPMISAHAWSSPTAPAKWADSVTAMAAVDDCITAVIASPATIKVRTANRLDHQRTPGPKIAGKSAGCNVSASPLIPCCSVVKPKSTSAKPASAAPAADRRPRPSSLIRAPTKIIGNAAAVSETRTPMSAMSQPVPVVPMFAPNTSARPCEKVSNPALTRPMVVIVVAIDDCTISVTNAPQNVPDSGVAAALLSVVRSLEPARAFRPPVMTLMPSRNRPTPPRTEIVVDMQATYLAALTRRQALAAVEIGHDLRPVLVGVEPAPEFLDTRRILCADPAGQYRVAGLLAELVANPALPLIGEDRGKALAQLQRLQQLPFAAVQPGLVTEAADVEAV